jgi:hypothetical protein
VLPIVLTQPGKKECRGRNAAGSTQAAAANPAKRDPSQKDKKRRAENIPLYFHLHTISGVNKIYQLVN